MTSISIHISRLLYNNCWFSIKSISAIKPNNQWNFGITTSPIQLIVSPILVLILPFFYKDQWCSISFIPTIQPIVFNLNTHFTFIVQQSIMLKQLYLSYTTNYLNSYTYSTSFIQILIILHQLHSFHSTDYFQFQRLLLIFCTRIDDVSATPPPLYN